MRADPEELAGIGCRVLGYEFGRFVTQFAQASQDVDQIGRFVALVVVRGIGLVGRIGLQQQARERQFGRGSTNLFCVLIGDRAAEADVEPQFDQLDGLFKAAGKTVYHTAQAGIGFDRIDHI